MLVTINNVDISEHISESSYIMNAVKNSKTWTDGNDNIHEIVTSEKVEGSFSVALYGRNGMDAKAFLQLVENATENNATTMLVYVSNKAQNKAIEASLNISSTTHKKLENGAYLDIFAVEVTER